MTTDEIINEDLIDDKKKSQVKVNRPHAAGNEENPTSELDDEMPYDQSFVIADPRFGTNIITIGGDDTDAAAKKASNRNEKNKLNKNYRVKNIFKSTVPPQEKHQTMQLAKSAARTPTV